MSKIEKPDVMDDKYTSDVFGVSRINADWDTYHEQEKAEWEAYRQKVRDAVREIEGMRADLASQSEDKDTEYGMFLCVQILKTHGLIEEEK